MTTPAYECDSCGACCKVFELIIEPSDIIREPRLANLGEDAANRYDTSLWGNGLRIIDQPCPFLAADFRCNVYQTRPDGCRMLEPGSSRCQDARSMVGLDPLLPSFSSKSQRIS